MNKGLKIGLNVFVALMILIGVLFCAWIFLSPPDGKAIDYSLILVVVQIGIAAVIAIVAGLLLFGLNIKKRLAALSGFVVFAILALIARYVMADGSTTGLLKPGTDQEVDSFTAYLVSAGLNFFYILLVIAVALALLGTIWSFLKKSVLK